ncbi:unnamed protein product [Lampetra fluviatilis]
MSTRRKVRVHASDDEVLIPPMAAEEGAETLPAEQSAVGARSASPSVAELIRDAHGCLADLQVASSILVEMRSLPSTTKGGHRSHPDGATRPPFHKGRERHRRCPRSRAPFCRRREAQSPPS